MDRSSDDGSSGSSGRVRSSKNNARYSTRSHYSSYRDDASVSSGSSRSHNPVWVAPNPAAAECFRDEDIFAIDGHSYAPAGAASSSQGSTIVGTFRPSLEDMVDVNVSGHGKKFQDGDALFRSREHGARRLSLFPLSADDMEYDAVGMTKRRCVTGLMIGLLLGAALITLAVVLTMTKPTVEGVSTLENPFPSGDGAFEDPTVTASDCNFENVLEPDVFLQCRCHGHISIFEEGVLVKYNDLKTNFIQKDVFPDFHSRIDSCDPVNQALVWLAADKYPEDSEIFDRFMLAMLYANWKGYEWTHQENWLLSSQSHCEWYGVECDSHHRTIDLLLGKNNLQGQIPSEIVKLESLRSLDLGENKLSGRVPREIGQFFSLVNLRISWNNLIFTIPTEFGLLENLKSLQLDNNELVGTLPTELMRIPNMDFIDVSSNKLTGTIPTEVGNLSKCREFRVQGNSLTGTIPTQVGGMQALTVWDSADNHCDGSIPTEFGYVITLVTLDLANMGLKGNFPSEFGQLTSLQSLSLGSNFIGGSIPSEFGGMNALQILILTQNALSGQIPEDFSLLRELTELYLQDNNLTGEVPGGLAACSNLVTVNLSGNEFKGQMPPEVCTLRQAGLQNMISDCSLDCSIPTCCSSCVP